MHKKILSPTNLLMMLAVLGGFGLVLYLAVGDVKPMDAIRWLDVIAEGATTILALFWLILLLRSRPAGRVTLLLSLGLSCFVFSWWMDFLDEFIKIPKEVFWDNWLESLPIPLGLVILTIGIYHWHKEERAISAQMIKRERVFREYRLFDALTPLGGAQYLREQVKLALSEAHSRKQPLSLIAIDIDNFTHINQSLGHREGDQVLQSVAQLLLLNLGDNDLLCRLAGDRFVAMLPNTNHERAENIARELRLAIQHFAYKSTQNNQRVYLSATTGVVATSPASEERQPDVNMFIKTLNSILSINKQSLQTA